MLACRFLPISVLLISLSACSLAWGQPLVRSGVVYFASGKYALTVPETKRLDSLTKGLTAPKDLAVVLNGFTDTIGNAAYNQRLSQKRAIAVKAWLVGHGFSEESIVIQANGATMPAAKNTTPEGRRLNRRVAFIISSKVASSLPPKSDSLAKPIIVADTKPPILPPPPQPTIADLYAQLGTPMQSFCINWRRDTVLRCAQGTVLYLKAHSLVPNAGGQQEGCVMLRVKEDFLKSDMILDNLSTTSDGAPLETQGMVYTEAVDASGNAVQLAQGMDLVILIPTDSINPSAKIFNGQRDHDNVINWTLNNRAELSGFTLRDMDMCGHLCGKKPKKCPFFVCRIKRFGKIIKGAFVSWQRGSNVRFRERQRELRQSLKMARMLTIDSTLKAVKYKSKEEILSQCSKLDDLFRKYRVEDVNALVLAINQPLLDSFKVSSMEQLQDTLAKVAKGKIELAYTDGKLSFEDFKYYIFNAPDLGWVNIDAFSMTGITERVDMQIALKPSPTTDCKLVFRDRRVILPAIRKSGSFSFEGVPKGERAFIVAIKYEDGKASLAIEDITIENKRYEVTVKALSLAELKEQLKVLDR